MKSNCQHKTLSRIAVFSLASMCTIALLRLASNIQFAQEKPVASIVTISAGSYATTIAPDSIAAGFTNLPLVTVGFAQDSDPSTPGVQLPKLMGGMSLEVNGRSAGLFYTSPNQINFQIPSDVEAGTGYVTVKSDKGVILAAGEITISSVAPAIFTANANGVGVPAGIIVRVKANGQQLFEPIARFDPLANQQVPQPIDLGPTGERVFLVLFLTGARRIARAADTRLLIGGNEYVPQFIGASGDLVGVEQLNFELPRTLNGRGALLLVAPGYPASNLCEIEVAPPANSPPRVAGLSVAAALAGDRLEISGSGFPASLTEAGAEVLIERADGKRFNAKIEEASTTRLRVLVPYGAGTGNLIVRTARGESAYPFTMRTSISGVVQTLELQANLQLVRVGVRNVAVRVQTANGVIERLTNEAGVFLLPDVPPASNTVLEVDGRMAIVGQQQNNLGQQPSLSMSVQAGRDNQYQGYLEVKAPTGGKVTANLDGTLPDAAFSMPAAAALEENVSSQTGQVVFETNGSTAQFPDGSRVNEVTVTPLDPGRTPADLPVGQFSTTIVQLTPFGARLNPGGKLTFPNPDGLPAGSTATLYRFDQTPGSNTLGKFVAAGAATVSADGQRIETARDAVKEITYYFVSIPRPLTTVYGSVVEDNGTPARGALVQVRGQSIFALTDQNGAFTLPNVPLIGARELTLEVSYLRADGTVDRTERGNLIPVQGGLTYVSPPIVLPGQGRTRAPVITAPKTLTIIAGQNSEIPFIAYARVAGQTLRNVTVSGASFATVIAQGNDRYTLRLTPAASVTGALPLTLSATDSQNLRTDEAIALEVRPPNNPAPLASSQSVATDEDTPVNVTLSGIGGTTYRIVSLPQNGNLSGTAPNLRYTPNPNFNGADSFSFALSNGTAESSPAVVALAVRPVNDAPCFGVDAGCGERGATSYTGNIGQPFNIVVNGFDVDAGQKLTLAATGLPAGATITQTTATSWVLSWTPKFDQLGSFTVNLTVRDEGVVVLSDTKALTLVVDAKWAQTSGPEASNIIDLLSSGNLMFASTFGGGVFRSTDEGVTWTAINSGLDDKFVEALAEKDLLLYAGTHNGVYRSTDNGARWESVSDGLPGAYVYDFAVLSDGLLAGTSVGVFWLRDNQTKWVELSRDLHDREVICFTASGTTLYAGLDGGEVFRSTNQGTNWTNVSKGLPDTSNVSALAAVGATLFAGLDDDGLFRSTNGGMEWEQVGDDGDALDSVNILDFAINGNRIYAGTRNGVFLSMNNGTDWTPLRDGLTQVEAPALLFHRANLFAGTDGDGIFRFDERRSYWIAQNGGLIGAGIGALARTPSAIFAGTTGGGVFRSLDNGTSWKTVNNGLTNRQIYAMQLSGTSLFTGTDTGAFRTTDNGQNWTNVSSGLGDRRVFSFAVNGSALYAGAVKLSDTDLRGGAFRSTDNGATWSEISSGLTNRNVLALAFHGTVLLAATGHPYESSAAGGVFRSTDNGASWVALRNGLPRDSFLTLVSNGSAIFAGTYENGVFRSTDNGTTWVAVNRGLASLQVEALIMNGAFLYAAVPYSGVFRSSDNGDTWVSLSSGLVGEDVRELLADGAMLIAGTFGRGVYRLNESAQTWSDSNAGLPTRNLNTALTSGDSFFVGTFGGGVFRSTDKGQSWLPANAGLPPAADVRAFTATNNGTLAGLADAGVHFSNDQGRTWTARNTGLSNQRINALASEGATVYAGTQSGVFRSFDGGMNWAAANSGLTRTTVLSLTISGNAVYAGTDNGLFRSTNQGASWTVVNTGLNDLYIVALGVAPNSTTLLAGTSSGLFRSTNQGQSWTPVTNGLPERVVALTFAQQRNRLLAGTVNGFFLSEDNGASWRQINGGLLSLQVGALAVSGDTVLAGTRSSGVFVSTLPQ